MKTYPPAAESAGKTIGDSLKKDSGGWNAKSDALVQSFYFSGYTE
jgi:hypothetical protein